jgi:hypothetical protein
MSTTNKTTWRELHPEGRSIFYEGDDPQGFCREIQAEFGFDPSADALWEEHASAAGYDTSRGFGWETCQCFWCPPEHLDAIYGSGRWPLGS